MHINRIDKPLLALILLLTLGGFFIYISASFKLISTKDTAGFLSALLNQFLFGVAAGLIVMFGASRIAPERWQKLSLFIFVTSVAVTLLVFVPYIGVELRGAKRWIDIGPVSFQPAEFLKLGVILYLASLLARNKKQFESFRGLLPFILVLSISGAILLSEPDTDTFGFIVLASLSMFVMAGGKWRHLLALIVIGVMCFAFLVETRPYLKNRVETFLRPEKADPLGSGYQIEQSLIAIGSGKLLGRGFGQSVQKFGFLPEPTSDSIFAVAAEEFGFLGGVTIITLFSAFAIRSLVIARKLKGNFGQLFIVGAVILIIGESFVNIASLTGLIPLAGTPLLFISHGGTALFFTLFMCGIMLSLSRQRQ